MSTRAMLLAALLLSGATLCAAAPKPQIPSSELPGRERERFIDPFPQPPRSEPLLVAPKPAKPRRDCRDRRSKKWKSGKRC